MDKQTYLSTVIENKNQKEVNHALHMLFRYFTDDPNLLDQLSEIAITTPDKWLHDTIQAYFAGAMLDADLLLVWTASRQYLDASRPVLLHNALELLKKIGYLDSIQEATAMDLMVIAQRLTQSMVDQQLLKEVLATLATFSILTFSAKDLIFLLQKQCQFLSHERIAWITNQLNKQSFPSLLPAVLDLMNQRKDGIFTMYLYNAIERTIETDADECYLYAQNHAIDMLNQENVPGDTHHLRFLVKYPHRSGLYDLIDLLLNNYIENNKPNISLLAKAILEAGPAHPDAFEAFSEAFKQLPSLTMIQIAGEYQVNHVDVVLDLMGFLTHEELVYQITATKALIAMEDPEINKDLFTFLEEIEGDHLPLLIEFSKINNSLAFDKLSTYAPQNGEELLMLYKGFANCQDSRANIVFRMGAIYDDPEICKISYQEIGKRKMNECIPTLLNAIQNETGSVLEFATKALLNLDVKPDLHDWTHLFHNCGFDPDALENITPLFEAYQKEIGFEPFFEWIKQPINHFYYSLMPWYLSFADPAIFTKGEELLQFNSNRHKQILKAFSKRPERALVQNFFCSILDGKLKVEDSLLPFVFETLRSFLPNKTVEDVLFNFASAHEQDFDAVYLYYFGDTSFETKFFSIFIASLVETFEIHMNTEQFTREWEQAVGTIPEIGVLKVIEKVSHNPSVAIRELMMEKEERCYAN
jgi:hypothetical protein